LEFDADPEGAYCKLCKKNGRALERTIGVWITRPFTNWKKVIEKMKAHDQTSNCSAQQGKAICFSTSDITSGRISHPTTSRYANQDRIKKIEQLSNTLFPVHIFLLISTFPISNFEKFIDLVVQYGGQDLKNFLEKSGRNAVHTSHVAVAEFIDAIGIWIQEILLEHLDLASCFSIMADECTDVATMEEILEEHFMEIIHLKQANAEIIYSTLIEFLKEKGFQVSKIVGMGFDRASAF